MRARKWILIWLSISLAAATATAEITSYENESDYLQDLVALGHPVLEEGFESDLDWGSVRTVFPQFRTAEEIAAQEINWTSNLLGGGITTSVGAARTGSWGFYARPHGDQTGLPADPQRDGFIGTSSVTLFGLGAWIDVAAPTSPADVLFFLDGDTEISFSPIANDDGFVFRGVIDTAGFTSFELVDVEGTVGDQVLIFADDFTLAALVPEPSSGLLGIAMALTLAVLRRSQRSRAAVLPI